MQPFAKNMAVEFADKAIPGGEIDGVFTELRGAVEDLEEDIVAKGFVGTATIVMPSGFALSELPTEVGFYKVTSAYQGYQGIMYVQTVGEHTNGFGMCANGKYYSFNDSVDLTMKDSFEFTGVVEVSQTGPSSYGITIPQVAGTYLVKAGGYTPKGAGILHSRDNGGSVRTIYGITVEGEIYSIYSATVGQTYNLTFTKLGGTKLYRHSIEISGAGAPYAFRVFTNSDTAITKNSDNYLVIDDLVSYTGWSTANQLTPLLVKTTSGFKLYKFNESTGVFEHFDLTNWSIQDTVTPL